MQIFYMCILGSIKPLEKTCGQKKKVSQWGNKKHSQNNILPMCVCATGTFINDYSIWKYLRLFGILSNRKAALPWGSNANLIQK